MSKRQELEIVLTDFCKWLEKKGYLDSDWWSEQPPNVVDTYLDRCAAATRILNEKEK